MNDIFWGKLYDNHNPEWLEHEWNIVSDPSSVEFHAFKSKEDFIEQLDFEMAQRSLQAAWDRACGDDQIQQEVK